jgi:hypothetical protein
VLNIKQDNPMLMGEFYKACMGVNMLNFARLKKLNNANSQTIVSVLYEFANSGIAISMLVSNGRFKLLEQVEVYRNIGASFEVNMFTKEQMTKLRIHFDNGNLHQMLNKFISLE